MKKISLILLTVAVVTLAVFFGLKWKGGKDSTEISFSGRVSKDIEASIQGKPVLLHFWAKWCEPCAEELPHLLEFARDLSKENPMQVVAVSLDPDLKDSKALIESVWKEAMPSRFHIAHDPKQEFAKQVGSFQFPETYYVSDQKKLLKKWVGPQPWSSPEVKEAFSQVR